MSEIKIELKNSLLTNKDITDSNNCTHKIQFGSIAVEKRLQPAFNQIIVFNYSIKCFIAYRNCGLTLFEKNRLKSNVISQTELRQFSH